MRKLNRYIVDFVLPCLVLTLFIVLIMVNSGCSLLGEVSEKAAREIGKGVKVYCEETIPDVRETFRAKVNEHAAPHEVRVTCADDMVLTTEREGTE